MIKGNISTITYVAMAFAFAILAGIGLATFILAYYLFTH